MVTYSWLVTTFVHLQLKVKVQLCDQAAVTPTTTPFPLDPFRSHGCTNVCTLESEMVFFVRRHRRRRHLALFRVCLLGVVHNCHVAVFSWAQYKKLATRRQQQQHQ